MGSQPGRGVRSFIELGEQALEAIARCEHTRWYQRRLAAGWSAAGAARAGGLRRGAAGFPANGPAAQHAAADLLLQTPRAVPPLRRQPPDQAAVRNP